MSYYLNQRTQPAVEAGWISADREATIRGQAYSGVPSGSGSSPTGTGTNVVAVKVGRQRMVLASGGFYAPRTETP